MALKYALEGQWFHFELVTRSALLELLADPLKPAKFSLPIYI